MTGLRAVLHEIFGLFVDSGSFALAILAWVIVAGFLLPRLGLASVATGPILFIGLGLILLESVIRHTRQSRRG